MNAATPTPEPTNPNAVPTLAEFKGWWVSASAEEQQRWWDAHVLRDIELQDHRAKARFPWRQDPYSLALEEELTTVKAALAAEREPKTGDTAQGLGSGLPLSGVRVVPLSALFGPRPPELPEDGVPAWPATPPCGNPFCTSVHPPQGAGKNPAPQAMSTEELRAHLDRTLRALFGGPAHQ